VPADVSDEVEKNFLDSIQAGQQPEYYDKPCLIITQIGKSTHVMAMQDPGVLASRSVIPVDQSLRTAMQPIEYHEFHSTLRSNRLKNNNRTPTYTFQEVCHVV
jgi:hypothetical protein